jgi:hypothetical protein
MDPSKVINATRKVRGENIAQLDDPIPIKTVKQLNAAGVDVVPKGRKLGVWTYILKSIQSLKKQKPPPNPAKPIENATIRRGSTYTTPKGRKLGVWTYTVKSTQAMEKQKPPPNPAKPIENATIRRGSTYTTPKGRWATWEAVDNSGAVRKIEIYKPANTPSRIAAKARLQAWIIRNSTSKQ